MKEQKKNTSGSSNEACRHTKLLNSVTTALDADENFRRCQRADRYRCLRISIQSSIRKREIIRKSDRCEGSKNATTFAVSQ